MTRSVLAAGLCVFLMCSLSVRADDPVRTKLDDAKAAYERATEEYQKETQAWFESQDEAARKARAGVAVKVKQVAAEKKRFEENGELPGRFPVAIKGKRAKAIDAMVKAYNLASESYYKQKMDDEAETIEKELGEFKKGTVALLATKPLVIFNGKNLSGWRGISDLWTVKDGTIVGSTRPDGIAFNTCLCSEREYGDFELACKMKLIGPAGANSGIQVRSEIVDPTRFMIRGPQCDVGESSWGSLYAEGGGMLQVADKALVSAALKPGEFNELWVRCVGQRVIIKLNGRVTVDKEFPGLPARGIIGWQLHSGKGFDVVIKDVEFKPLPPLK